MRTGNYRLVACIVGALAMGTTVAACGEDDEGGGGGATATGDTLNVYSSLPLQGASRTQTVALVNGIKLAVEQANGKAGRFNVKYESLDDSTAQAGTWEPGQVSANARKVAQDDNAIAYIGEFNSGASAISMPILNEANVPQVSPANTAVGLTSDEPGADKGEPEKYYPTGNRHYVRIVPKDTIQGAALASLMMDEGCTKVQLLNDKEVYGAGLARNIENSAGEIGLEIIGNEAIDKNAPNYRSLADQAKGAGADCMVYSGITANNAVQIYKDFAAALPDAKLFGPDGVAESGFADPKEGGIPPDVAERTLVTVATLAPDQYPPEGKEFFQEFEQKYGEKNPDPYAIYGYEAMRLVIDALERAGEKANDKQAVIDALFDTKGRESVLGTYDIDENGDTTLTDYGVYSVSNGELEFDRTIQAGAPGGAEPDGDAPGGAAGPGEENEDTP